MLRPLTVRQPHCRTTPSRAGDATRRDPSRIWPRRKRTAGSEIAPIIPAHYPLVWGLSTPGLTVYWDLRLSTTGSPHG